MALHLVTEDLSLEHKLKVAYAAWARGDASMLASLVADDCELTILGNPALNPHSGLRVGHTGICDALTQFHRIFDVRDFLIEKMIVKGDDAVVHWHSSLIIRANGRVIDSERCDLITFRDGLARSIKGFYDSATMALVSGRAQVAPSDGVFDGTAPGATKAQASRT